MAEDSALGDSEAGNVEMLVIRRDEHIMHLTMPCYVQAWGLASDTGPNPKSQSGS